MKTLLITSAAALLAAGSAVAGQIQVIEDPDSETTITVRQVPYEMLTGQSATFDDEGGMMSQDVVDGAEDVPGFNADVLINIWTNDDGTVRLEQFPATE